jgi:small GTP-binding protein
MGLASTMVSMADRAEVKVVFLGDVGVGKTCVISMATSGYFGEETCTTLCVAFWSKTVTVDSFQVHLQLWDTAGQERFRTMSPSYFHHARAALIVYAITDEASFAAIDSWVETLGKPAEENILRVLVGNKTDLDSDRVISTERGEMKAREIDAMFFEVSAKTGEGLDALCEAIASHWLHRECCENLAMQVAPQFIATNADRGTRCC